MSLSKFTLKQELFYKSEKSKDRAYQYGVCTVYRGAPDKVVLEVSKDPRKYLSEIIEVNPSEHDNILRVTTKDDIKYFNFDSRSDRNAWCDTIGGLMESCEISSRPRAQSVETRTRPRHGREERKVKTSPAAVEEMFSEMVHSDRKLEPVSLDDDSPTYVNSYFNRGLVEDRVAYSDQHDIKQMQEENYQPLIQEEETVDTNDEVDVYEDVFPSQPLPLTSKVDQPQEPSGLANKKKALLPPKQKHRHAKAPLPNPKPQDGTGCKPSVKEDCPAEKMGALPKQPSNLRPAARNNSRVIIPGPGHLQSYDESIISRPGSLSSNENDHHIHGREHPLPSYDLPYQGRDGKIPPPIPPPKHTKPKPTAQVMPQLTADDDIYANEYPLDQDGRELEANCDTKEKVRTIRRRDGSVSSFEVEKNVQIPSREFKVGDVCLADKEGAVVIERTNLSKYLNAGDQLLQINDIDVEHKGKDFAHICLGSVSSSHINLKILRQFHQG